MNDTLYTKLVGWGLLLLMSGCIDPYRPPEIASPDSYLVVSGFFNSTPGTTTTIQLARTQNLTDTKAPTAETKAQVTIESQNKASYILREGTSGVYSLSGVTPQVGETYRLHVRTTKGLDYYSDYVPVVPTPPIDSVGWHVENDGLQITVNAHDAKNATHYYRWEFDETWEYSSVYRSGQEVKNGQIVARQQDVNTCWSSASSTNLLTFSTTRLSQDVVSQFPLTTIPSTSIRLGVRYSILVRQIALTQDGFTYYDQLGRITQNIGSIFDPQPTQITGNIRSSTNPGDLVLGFFRVGSIETKRIFITKYQLPAWRTNSGLGSCDVDTLSIADVKSSQPGIISQYNSASYITTMLDCVDCRLRGGVTQRPSFW